MRAKLTVEEGPGKGRSYVLRVGQAFHVGRSRKVAVYLDDPKVSRRHAVLEILGGKLVLVDLNSTNGTVLNGRRIAVGDPTELSADDVLEFGSHVLRVELAGFDERARKSTNRLKRLDASFLPEDEFEVLGVLGEGAASRVWAARQKLLNRPVAIKVLKPEAWEEETERERVLRAARACQRIQSPHVATVHDIRLLGGRACVVIELVQGPSAMDRLESGPPPIAEALKIGEDVARGLQAAHDVGVIHRDLKPHNILLAPEGIAKLADFGIAKDLKDTGSLTQAGTFLGSLNYTAPEQATDAGSVDARSDVYGLGATLYHLVSGRAPFVARTAADVVSVLQQILSSPPPRLVDLRPECPHDVAAAIQQMLEKDPADRPQTAGSVAERLKDLRERHYPQFSVDWDEEDEDDDEDDEFGVTTC